MIKESCLINLYISLSVNFNNVIIMNDELIKDFFLLHVIYLNSKQLYGVFINKRCQQRYPISLFEIHFNSSVS